MAKAEKKPLTKTQIIAELSEKSGLTKKEVASVLEGMTELINTSLSKSGAGSFTLPGLVKIEKKRKPRVPAKKGWMNPFTKQLEDRPAKPACDVVKVRALKALKDMVL
jgi:nucleoid DNA-binding protein